MRRDETRRNATKRKERKGQERKRNERKRNETKERIAIKTKQYINANMQGEREPARCNAQRQRQQEGRGGQARLSPVVSPTAGSGPYTKTRKTPQYCLYLAQVEAGLHVERGRAVVAADQGSALPALRASVLPQARVNTHIVIVVVVVVTSIANVFKNKQEQHQLCRLWYRLRIVAMVLFYQRIQTFVSEHESAAISMTVNNTSCVD